MFSLFIFFIHFSRGSAEPICPYMWGTPMYQSHRSFDAALDPYGGRGIRGNRPPPPAWIGHCSVVCSFCAIIAAVPPRPQDGTVSVIVLFAIVFGCMTDCNCNLYYCKVPLQRTCS